MPRVGQDPDVNHSLYGGTYTLATSPKRTVVCVYRPISFWQSGAWPQPPSIMATEGETTNR
jgi:hypothetical protein